MEKNKVVLIVKQCIPAYVTKQGNTVEAYENEVEFTSETTRQMNAENVACFAVCALKKYQRLQRLQGKTGFKMSKEITLTIKVNNKAQETVSMKFSLNQDRLLSILNRTPLLLAEAFVMNPSVGGLTISKAQQYLTTPADKVILAKHIAESVDVLNEESTSIEA